MQFKVHKRSLSGPMKFIPFYFDGFSINIDTKTWNGQFCILGVASQNLYKMMYLIVLI